MNDKSTESNEEMLLTGSTNSGKESVNAWVSERVWVNKSVEERRERRKEGRRKEEKVFNLNAYDSKHSSRPYYVKKILILCYKASPPK